MKLLMLPCAYVPHWIGGREVYTHGLATRLRAKGHDVRVAFHVSFGRPEPGYYEYEEVPVNALPPLPKPTREQSYACRADTLPGYQDLLEQFRPEIVHAHDYSYGVTLDHLALARQFGAKVVLTYHSPGQSCTQRWLLHKGQTPCDGMIDLQRCTACRLACNGAPAPLSELFSRVDLAALATVLPGRFKRLATGRHMTRVFYKNWLSMCEQVDRIHVHAEWTRQLLRRNHVPMEKIRLIRVGTSLDNSVQAPDESLWNHPRSVTQLRIVYAGRAEEVKGVHVVISAVQQLPKDVAVEFLVLSVLDNSPYGHWLRQLADGDERIIFAPDIPRQRLSAIVRTADVWAVPSLWLETGPMTPLEAWSVGLPVVGSRLGGVAELVQDGTDGLLFPPGDAKLLANILCELARNPAEIERLRQGVRKPRTADDVCTEMTSLYYELVS